MRKKNDNAQGSNPFHGTTAQEARKRGYVEQERARRLRGALDIPTFVGADKNSVARGSAKGAAKTAAKAKAERYEQTVAAREESRLRMEERNRQQKAALDALANVLGYPTLNPKGEKA
jgi:hypothetical protein